MRTGLLALVAGVAFTLVPAPPAAAAGPWKAQILDAETAQPLEGVVVLAAWFRRYTSPGGAAGGGYHASEEVVTGPDGRFVIQARSTFTLLPFITVIKGPEFVIFKPGYGQWRFLDSETWLRLPPDQRDARFKAAWEQFRGEGAILELPPLKTREERLKSLPSRNLAVPFSKMSELTAAISRERVFLGLAPLAPDSGSEVER
jgi:hypothetical protein